MCMASSSHSGCWADRVLALGSGGWGGVGWGDERGYGVLQKEKSHMDCSLPGSSIRGIF